MRSPGQCSAAANSEADKGWTVELAFPWQDMKPLAAGRSLLPRDGDVWRIFFGRFELLKPGVHHTDLKELPGGGSACCRSHMPFADCPATAVLYDETNRLRTRTIRLQKFSMAGFLQVNSHLVRFKGKSVTLEIIARGCCV